jgi:DNA-binding response OmpR family regulator
VFSRQELLSEVWGSSEDWQVPATVTEHVRRVRLKLETDPTNPKWIHNVRGVGYRFAN